MTWTGRTAHDACAAWPKLALLRSCGPGLPIGVWNRDKEGTRAGQAVGTNTVRHAIPVKEA